MEKRQLILLDKMSRSSGSKGGLVSGLTLGSLFDGIGVFPLAASRCGIRPLWASGKNIGTCIGIDYRADKIIEAFGFVNIHHVTLHRQR